MKEEIEENLELIAVRVPPGDNWKLEIETISPESVEGLTTALTEYMRETGFKGAYRLEPLNGKLYAIKETTVKVEEEVEQKWDLYGEG